MKLMKFAPLALVAMTSLPAMAVEKSITILANVDPSLEILQSDGSPLPQSMEMAYLPGAGLQPARVGTRIYSNDTSNDMSLKLIVDPVLAHTTNPNASSVPLSVNYGGRTLSETVPVTLPAADLFPGGDPSSGSIEQMLEVRQKTPAAITSAGNYSGIVQLLLTQVP